MEQTIDVMSYPISINLDEKVHYYVRDVNTHELLKRGVCKGNTWLSAGKNAIAAAIGTESNVNYFNRVYAKVDGTPEYTASQNHSRASNVLSIDSDWFSTAGTYQVVLGSKDALYYNSIDTNIEMLAGQEIKFTIEYTFTLSGHANAGAACAARLGALGDAMDHAIGTIETTGGGAEATSNSTTGNVLTVENAAAFTYGVQTDVEIVSFALNVVGTYFATYTSGFTIPVDTTEEFWVKADFTFG